MSDVRSEAPREVRRIACALLAGREPWGSDGPQTLTDWDECAAAWREVARERGAELQRLGKYANGETDKLRDALRELDEQGSELERLREQHERDLIHLSEAHAARRIAEAKVERLREVLLAVDVDYTAEGYPRTSPERERIWDGLRAVDMGRNEGQESAE